MTEQQLAAMRQALEALESFAPHNGVFWRNLHKDDAEIANAITALRTAIAEAESRASEQAMKQEPTGQAPCARHCEATAFQIVIKNLKVDIERLKATPPAAQRQWVGLTDAEISKEFHPLHQTAHEFARAIEAKLRAVNGFSCSATEKNGGNA